MVHLQPQWPSDAEAAALKWPIPRELPRCCSCCEFASLSPQPLDPNPRLQRARRLPLWHRAGSAGGCAGERRGASRDERPVATRDGKPDGKRARSLSTRSAHGQMQQRQKGRQTHRCQSEMKSGDRCDRWSSSLARRQSELPQQLTAAPLQHQQAAQRQKPPVASRSVGMTSAGDPSLLAGRRKEAAGTSRATSSAGGSARENAHCWHRWTSCGNGGANSC
jgi:hypothetical protein